MKQFRIETTDEFICGNSGLIMVGSLINKQSFKAKVNQLSIDDSQKDISNLDILKSYIGLLSLGKNSYETIDEYKNDLFFKESLQIEQLPSKESLRQRLESLSTKEVENIVKSFNSEIIKKCGELHTAKDTDLVPVDFDVSPFDNSNSNKQGVSRTYKQVDGFAPMLTYIGGTGYMLNNEFRKGSAHSNCEGTSEYIEKTIEYAQSITNKKLLCRFDSGNDSVENIDTIHQYPDVFYLIKKNFRREDQNPYISFAKEETAIKETPRKGKTIYYNSKEVKLTLKDNKNKVIKEVLTRLIVRLIERTIDKTGNGLLIPEIELEAWYCNLQDYKEKEIISLYADHGTSEQFHSEFKTDMDMERLPSGKFETNSLVITLGMLAFNILRAMGQEALNSGLLKRKRKVKRIRIRKVLQDIMYMACNYMIKFRQNTIKLATHNAFTGTFKFAYKKIAFS